VPLDGGCCPTDDCGQCGACINGKCMEVPGICDEGCERCNPSTWTCESRCSGMFGTCCNGQCRLTESGPWTVCGDFCCPGGKACCTNGGLSLCCDPGDVCPAPCSSGIDIACCTPQAHAIGHCCPGG
jgi:hypothetical protein